jgi:undecaprenyl-diphosphatase
VDFLEAIILGLIQGATEFLPISSTAHLRVVPALLGWKDPGASFTAVSQLGTLAATIVYFWKDILRLAAGAWEGVRQRRPLEHPQSRLAFGIIVGTLPIGICGILFKDQIKTTLRSLDVVALSLIGLAVLLLLSEKLAKHRRDLSEMRFSDAVIVGFAQALALIPGASRSGVTIMAGLFLGLKRDTAARFSFLLSLPAIGAAGLFELKDVVEAGPMGDLLVPTIIATVVAGVAGYGAIAFLLNYLRTRSTGVFIGYRIALGALLLGLIAFGVLER